MRPRTRLGGFYNRSSEQTARWFPGIGGALYSRRDDAARVHIRRLPDRLRAGFLATHHLSEDRILDPGDPQRFRAIDSSADAGYELEAEMIELSIARITRIAILLGVIGVLVAFGLRGPRDAVGFLV